MYGFEEYCTSTAITFRMDLPLKQGPRSEAKPEGGAGGTAATSSSSEEQTGLLDGEPRSAQAAVCKVPSTSCYFIQVIAFISEDHLTKFMIITVVGGET